MRIISLLMVVVVLALIPNGIWAQGKPTVAVVWNDDTGRDRIWRSHYLNGSDRYIVLGEAEKFLATHYTVIPPAGSRRDQARQRELRRQYSLHHYRGENRAPIGKGTNAQYLCYVSARTDGLSYRDYYSQVLRKQKEDVTLHVDLQLQKVDSGEILEHWTSRGRSRVRTRTEDDWRRLASVVGRYCNRDTREVLRMIAPRQRRETRPDRHIIWAALIASAVEDAFLNIPTRTHTPSLTPKK